MNMKFYCYYLINFLFFSLFFWFNECLLGESIWNLTPSYDVSCASGSFYFSNLFSIFSLRSLLLHFCTYIVREWALEAFPYLRNTDLCESIYLPLRFSRNTKSAIVSKVHVFHFLDHCVCFLHTPLSPQQFHWQSHGLWSYPELEEVGEARRIAILHWDHVQVWKIEAFFLLSSPKVPFQLYGPSYTLWGFFSLLYLVNTAMDISVR